MPEKALKSPESPAGRTFIPHKRGPCGTPGIPREARIGNPSVSPFHIPYPGSDWPWRSLQGMDLTGIHGQRGVNPSNVATPCGSNLEIPGPLTNPEPINTRDRRYPCMNPFHTGECDRGVP